MRFPGGRHASSTRSIRKGDSLSGVSLSPILIPSPILASPILESPTPGARVEHPWGLPDISIVPEITNSKIHFAKRQGKKSGPCRGVETTSVQSLCPVNRSGWDRGFRSCSCLSFLSKILSSSCLCISKRAPCSTENRSYVGGQCRLHRHTNHNATTPSATTPL